MVANLFPDFIVMDFLNRLSLNILVIHSNLFHKEGTLFGINNAPLIDPSLFALLIFDNFFLTENIEANKTGAIIVIVRSQPVDKYPDKGR